MTQLHDDNHHHMHTLRGDDGMESAQNMSKDMFWDVGTFFFILFNYFISNECFLCIYWYYNGYMTIQIHKYMTTRWLHNSWHGCPNHSHNRRGGRWWQGKTLRRDDREEVGNDNNWPKRCQTHCLGLHEFFSPSLFVFIILIDILFTVSRFYSTKCTMEREEASEDEKWPKWCQTRCFDLHKFFILPFSCFLY